MSAERLNDSSNLAPLSLPVTAPSRGQHGIGPLPELFSGAGSVGDGLAFPPEPQRPVVAAGKRRRRRREERGLPSDDALADLAKTYLEIQRRLWPQADLRRELPKPTTDNMLRMAGEFKRRFLGTLGLENRAPIETANTLACSYLRYSSDNSNARSLNQQLRLQLEKAAANGHFIPWSFVFADAAVSGTTAARRGYEMSKASLQNAVLEIKVLYIDELGRASRDAVETLQLGRLVQRLKRRLLGVSDGTDSESPMFKFMLSIFAALQEWFIDQLRSKVNRGLDDAFDRGGSTGLAGLGYKHVPLLDENCHPVYGKDGEPMKRLAVDEVEAKYVLMAFELFAIQRWSPERIARRFNELAVGGTKAWDGSRIRKQILNNYNYIGISTYRKTRRVVDPETGKGTTIQCPRSTWKVRRAPELKIIPRDLWKKTKRRLAECRKAFTGRSGDDKSRTEVYPKSLFRPICECCHAPMIFGHSGKYPSFTCPNGMMKKHDCKNQGHKSVRIVEQAILSHIKEQVLTPTRLDELISRANDYLAELAMLPKTDATHFENEIRRLERKIEVIYRLTYDGKHDVEGARKRLRSYGRRLKKCKKERAAALASNAPPPPLLSTADVDWIVRDLREILSLSVAESAPVLRELTGPIMVRIDREANGKTPTWTAKFAVNLVPVIAKLTKDKDCPIAGTWEYLHTRGWTIPMNTDLPIDGDNPKYERLAVQVKEWKDRGASISTISSALGVDWQKAKNALVFATTGERPKWPAKPRKKPNPSGKVQTKYVGIAPEVGRLRDVERQTMPAIAKATTVSNDTVRRAFDYGHPERMRAAAEQGVAPNRGTWSLLGEEKYRQIRKLLPTTDNLKEIAEAVDCSESTVRRELKKNPHLKYAGAKIRRPRRRPVHTTPRVYTKPWPYQIVSPDVVRLHDDEKLSFTKIQKRLGISDHTARRAYDYGHPEIVQAAFASGEPPNRGPRSRLGAAKKNKILKMIVDKRSTAEIVRVSRASRTTVNRLRKRVS